MSLGGWEVGQIWKKLEEGKEYDQNIMFEKKFKENETKTFKKQYLITSEIFVYVWL